MRLQKYLHMHTSTDQLFKSHVYCTIGVCHTNTQNSQTKGIMGKWALPWNVQRALYLIQCMEQRKGPQNNVRKILLQSQIHHKYITNTTVTPGDAVIQKKKKLTEALKGNLHIAMYKSGTNQLNRLDAMFNVIDKKFWKQKYKQHPQLG